ncbi:hypothetical protein V2P20_07815 [Methylobacter sp. Wu1]|uniref:hypothetical protein n=1 Tax=Methylobacter sp. Wu1 TaxID=3119359 RepID=UPI002F928CAC
MKIVPSLVRQVPASNKKGMNAFFGRMDNSELSASVRRNVSVFAPIRSFSAGFDLILELIHR